MSLFERNEFDWSAIMEFPYESPGSGKQVINFFPTDKPYKDDPNAVAFVEKHLHSAKAFEVDATIIRYASDNVAIEGYYLEMGVCRGTTINLIAGLNSEKAIYGFDSFEGLPGDWEGRTDAVIPKGIFRFKEGTPLPHVLHNVRLIKGWYEDTLPEFKQEILKDSPIAFIHVDCDIYSSTRDVFTYLGDNIVDGTLILFDELYNYPGYEEHEYKALEGFLKASGKKAEYVAFNVNWEQVLVRIKE